MISVIITTKNEEKNIEDCIRSVLDQDYPKENLEIIVVDNNSTDKTREIATKYASKVFNLAEEADLSTVKNFRGAQLNFGVEKSRGEIVFFPDADMTFDPELFSDAIRKLESDDALFVPEIICGQGFFGKIRNFERSFYNETPIDGIRFVKKEIFLQSGGFDVANIMFGPDDWDFTKKLKKNGCRISITEKPLFHHEEWLTLGVYINKKGKYVNTFDGYIQKWGKNDPDIKKQFGVSYRFFGVFLEKGKWKKLLSHPILAIGMYGVRFLVGLKFLFKS